MGDDEWYSRHHRPPARHQHSGGYYLDPGATYRRDPNGLYRTRSQGHSPTPIVNVYNDVYQDSNLRADQSPPYPTAAVPGAFPVAAPEPRGRRLGEELLADELAELRLERRLRSRSRGRTDASSPGRSEFYKYEIERLERERRAREAEELAELKAERRLRSRSRGRGSDTTSPGRSDFYKYEMERLERERRELDRADAWKKEEARVKAELEAKQLKEDAKREHDEHEREEDRKRIIAEYEKKQRDAADKAKAEELRILEKLEREKREAKEKEEREWKEFERKQKEKKEKEEKEKKEEQQRLDDAMRKRLIESGLSTYQIEQIMDKEKEKKRTTTTTTTTTLTSSRALQPFGHHQPVYAKIHTDYLSIETLRYYDIPWEYDRVSSSFPPSIHFTDQKTSLTQITSSCYARWTNTTPMSSSTTRRPFEPAACCSMRPRRRNRSMLGTGSEIGARAAIAAGAEGSGRGLGSWSIRSDE